MEKTYSFVCESVIENCFSTGTGVKININLPPRCRSRLRGNDIEGVAIVYFI